MAKKHQFRLVTMDYFDNVIEVLYESPYLSGKIEFDPKGDFEKKMYETLIHYSTVYNFCDYENCPPMEFQVRAEGEEEWTYYSDPIEDYYNT